MGAEIISHLPSLEPEICIISLVSPWNSYRTQIIQIVLNYGITHIGNYAFSGFENITSIVILNSVISIGTNAFQICSSVTSITIGEGVKTIGNHTFNGLPVLNTINFSATNFLTTGTLW